MAEYFFPKTGRRYRSLNDNIPKGEGEGTIIFGYDYFAVFDPFANVVRRHTTKLHGFWTGRTNAFDEQRKYAAFLNRPILDRGADLNIFGEV